MEKIELNDFYNDGFGWICKACEREQKNRQPEEKTSRLMREGELESKQLKLSNTALAKWSDSSQRSLICPRCGIMELADKF
jgi:hypothetical protein